MGDDFSSADVIFHVGAPKTGSSTIQNICLLNRPALERHGYYYPKHRVDVNGVSGGHGALTTRLFDDDLSGAEKWLKSQLKKARAKNIKLLVCAEGLYQQASKLKKIMPDCNSAVVGYIRNPVESLVSNYNQGVKRSFFTEGLLEFCWSVLQGPPDKFHSGKMLEEWIENFSLEQMHFKPFGRPFFEGGSLENDFFGSLGISEAELAGWEFPESKINGSYNVSVLQLKQILNLFLDKTAVRENNKLDILLQGFSDISSEESASAVGSLGENLHRQLLSFFSEDIAWVNKEVFNGQYPGLWSDKFVGGSRGAFRSQLSLENTYQLAIATDSKLEKYILSCAKKRLPGLPQASLVYSLLPVLAGEGVGFKAESLSKTLRNISPALLEDAKDMADYQRDLALIYEAAGDYDVAKKLVSLALKERPSGPLINKIYNRLFD